MTTPGINSQPKITIQSTSGSSATIYLHGAHVASWTDDKGRELLWLSKGAIFDGKKAIRGGIPICWPQFGDMGPCKAQHGFARNSTFELVSHSNDSATLKLTDPVGNKEYPYPFELSVTVTITDNALKQQLGVKNIGTIPLPFTTALHTYFAINDITKCTVTGLKGIEYLDSLQQRQKFTEQNSQVAFDGEVDRIYIATPDTLSISDASSQHTIHVSKDQFPDAVVWNPHIQKALAMADFDDDGWKQMVCVEVAVAGSGPIILSPGKEWTGTQILSC